jgi:hypothetical protein
MARLDVKSAVDTAVTSRSTRPVLASNTLIIKEPSGLLCKYKREAGTHTQ